MTGVGAVNDASRNGHEQVRWEAVNRLTRILYENTSPCDDWEAFLEEGCRAFDATSAHLGRLDVETGTISLDQAHGYEVKREDYRRYQRLKDSDFRLPPLKSSPNVSMHCREIISDEEIWGTNIYQEVLHPLNIEFTLAVNVSNNPSTVRFLLFFRGRDQEPFTTEDCRLLQVLVPHLHQASKIHGERLRSDEITNSACVALQASQTGWFLLDSSLTVIAANNVAWSLITETSREPGGRLDFKTGEGRKLSDHIVELQRDDTRLISIMRGVFEVSDTLPMILVKHESLKPGPVFSEASGKTFTVLISTSVDGGDLPRARVIRELYGATRRQAEIAVLVCAGYSVEQAAERMGIKLNSARQYLKQVMAVVGVQTQAQLSSRIARLLVAP